MSNKVTPEAERLLSQGGDEDESTSVHSSGSAHQEQLEPVPVVRGAVDEVPAPAGGATVYDEEKHPESPGRHVVDSSDPVAAALSSSSRPQSAMSQNSQRTRIPGAVSNSKDDLLGSRNDSEDDEDNEADAIVPLAARSSSQATLGSEEEKKTPAPGALKKSTSEMSEYHSILSFGDIGMTLDSAPETKSGWDKIDELETKLQDEQVDRFDEMLYQEVNDDVMIIGSIPTEEIEMQERKMEKDRVEHLMTEAEAHKQRMNEISIREQRAKKNVVQEMRQGKKELRFRENRLVKRHFHHVKDQQEAFRKMEDRMKRILGQHQGKLQEYFGDLEDADDLYGAVRGRRYKVDWSLAPRMVRIRVDMLRAVKNKLPRGRYVVMATLYDRLGGHPLRWSKLHGAKWTGSTPYPRRHQGKFYNLEMSFAQKKNRIFLACPSEVESRPSMVIVFELFLCRGRRSKTDKVVGWGAFPVSDSKFDLIQGKFVVPMLRGEMDPSLDKFQGIEERMSKNLDSWLCNMYFDVRHLPRYINGMKEYEVEMEFTGDLMKTKTRKDENGIESDSDQSADEIEEAEEEESNSEEEEEDEEEEDESEIDSEDIDDEDEEKKTLTGSKPRSSKNRTGSTEESKTKDKGKSEKGKTGPAFDAVDSTASNKGSNRRKHVVVKSADQKDGESDGEGVAYDSNKGNGLQWIINKIKNDGYQPLDTGDDKQKLSPRTYELPGKDTVVNVKSTVHQGLFKEQPEWEPIAETLTKKAGANNALKKAKELERYAFSVVDVTKDVPVKSEAKEKAKYLFSEIVADLQLNRWKTIEFWSMLLCLLLVFWMRLYIHCAGQWVYLKGMRVPVYEFDARVLTCELSYNNDNLETLTEVGVVAMGVLSNIIVFSGLLMISFIFQGILRTFSDTASRFLLSYGLATLLDPFLILLIDLCYENWSGDSFKLYNYFEKTEGNGMAGIFLTVIITSVLVILSAFLLYNYILHIHMNGRMLDVYYRLHGDGSSFFLPDDMEISARTLRWILQKAKNWRGFHGATRKVSIVNYTMKDHLDPRFEEKTVHLALYTQDLYGERELFRHFTRRPDGAIIEMFDSVELMGADNFRNLEQLLLGKTATDELDFFEQDGVSTAGSPSALMGRQYTQNSAFPAVSTRNFSIMSNMFSKTDARKASMMSTAPGSPLRVQTAIRAMRQRKLGTPDAKSRLLSSPSKIDRGSHLDLPNFESDQKYN